MARAPISVMDRFLISQISKDILRPMRNPCGVQNICHIAEEEEMKCDELQDVPTNRAAVNGACEGDLTCPIAKVSFEVEA